MWQGRFLLWFLVLGGSGGCAPSEPGTDHVAEARELPDFQRLTHYQETSPDDAASQTQRQQGAKNSAGKCIQDQVGQEPRHQGAAARADTQAGDVHHEIPTVQVGYLPFELTPAELDPHQVGQRIGSCECCCCPRGIVDQMDQQQGAYCVHSSYYELKPERGAGVLQSVEGAKADELHGERHRAQGEGPKSPGDQVGVAAALAMAEQQGGHGVGERQENHRGGHQGHQRQSHCFASLGRDALEVPLGGQPGCVGQHCGCQGDRDQGMRHHPDQAGVSVDVGASTGSGGRRRGGQTVDQHQHGLVDEHETQGPLGQLEGLAQPCSPEVETWPEPEADFFHERDQHEGLGCDPQRGADAQQQYLLRGERTRMVPSGAPDHQVETQHEDRDDVVGDRRPHHGTELVARIEDLPQHRVGAVEEDLRQGAVGQRHHRGVLGLEVRGAVGIRRVEERDQGGQEGQDHRHHADGQHESGHDPVRERFAAVLVMTDGAHDLRYQNRVDRATHEQDVHAVGDRARQRQDVGLSGAVAEDEGHQHRPQDPETPGNERPSRHQGARGKQFAGVAHTATGTTAHDSPWLVPSAPP